MCSSDLENVSKEQVEIAVKEIESYVQNSNRNLKFSIDEEIGRAVVKVMDGDMGKMIRQIR